VVDYTAMLEAEEAGVGTVTLNRPKRMHLEINYAITELGTRR
jgi:hypothetical protein